MHTWDGELADGAVWIPLLREVGRDFNCIFVHVMCVNIAKIITDLSEDKNLSLYIYMYIHTSIYIYTHTYIYV